MALPDRNEENIRKLADEIGYKYKYDPKTDNYAHASGIVVATPDGHVSRYFYGVEYPAGQMKLALTEASAGKIGSVVDQVILFCYHYDPQTGKYGLAIFRVMQVACFSTIFLLGLFIVPAIIKDAKAPKLMPTVSPSGAVKEDKA
jgi:protein SCO1/2